MRVAETPHCLRSVIDHPAVRPWVKPDGHEGATPLAAIFEEGIGLEFDTGGFFFHRLGDGVFEVHTLFLPGTKNALDCCWAAAHYLFASTEGTRIVTKVPEDNVPGWRLTEKMGFRLDRTIPAAYLRNEVWHNVRHYSLAMDVWLHDQGPAWFQEQCQLVGNTGKGQRALYRWAVMYDEWALLRVA